MPSSKILVSIIAYNVATMCGTETIATWAIIGLIAALRMKTLMSEMLLLSGL